jgi:hypothetical protein
MGMDVYGKNPKSEKGTYFRRNVWGWRPLWDYCLDRHTDLAGKVKNGHTNDGDGLDANDSVELARLLVKDLSDGTASTYVKARNIHLSLLPRENCEWCQGTGIRTDKVGVENKMSDRELSPDLAILLGREKGWCNGCNGEGKKDSWETNYDLELDDIKEFAEFLTDSGGFEIC